MRALAIELADRGDRDRYDRLFEDCPRAFIQQSSHWADAIAPLGPDRPLFLLCEHDGADVGGLPLYLFEHSLGNLLTSVPQAGPLGGVFTREGLDRATRRGVYRALIDAALELASAHDCQAMTAITNPFTCDLDLYEELLAPTYVLENFTQFIPLDRPIEVSKSFRKNLNRARRAGYDVESSTSLADLEAWYPIHAERHRAIGARPLSLELLRSLLGVLGPRGKAELVLVRSGDEVVGGCLYVQHRDVMDVYILSSRSEHLERGVNLLNTDRSLAMAGEMGVKLYNWQSSPGRASGVYTYKERWGSVEAPYYFVTRLLGDLDRLRAIGPAALREAYPGHYVVPLGVFDEGPDQRRFRKE